MNFQHRICVLVIAAAWPASVAAARADEPGAVAIPAARQIAPSPEFSSTQAAEAALHDNQTRLQAAKFLARSGPQGVAVLERAARARETGIWFAAMLYLETYDPARAEALSLELLPENHFLKDARGQRMEFGYGSENGCFVIPNDFGAELAKSLGRIGDTRAIPLLRDAARDGDAAVRPAALEALVRLKAISLDELFAAGPELSNVISNIGCEDIHQNPRRAISIFDRIITAFSDQPFQVAAAHFWKGQCFINLKEPQHALAEYEAVLKFPKFESLTQQVTQRKAELTRPVR